MPDLVTTADCKAALRILTSDFDAEIAALVSAASAMVINYLDTQADDLLDLDTSGDLTTSSVIPEPVKRATIYLVGVLFRAPENNEQSDWERGYLPQPVTAMLYPLRDPTIA